MIFGAIKKVALILASPTNSGDCLRDGYGCSFHKGIQFSEQFHQLMEPAMDVTNYVEFHRQHLIS